ncbi:MAG: heme o synthase [Gammaproteobacteria bacterium]
MSHTMTATTAAHWRDYAGVCKLKVVALIVFTAVVGMFLAVPGMVPWTALIFGNLGIGLAAASAAAINHVVDQHIDAKMSRTRDRPVASGHITGKQCLGFALILGTIAMLILVLFVNILTAVLTFASLIGYAVVYTMYLKRATPQNIVIGGAAGAAPPVLGWTAVTGSVDPNALLLFLIVFVWTPPHFWALAIHRRNEYAKADVPMLPVTHGVEFTRLQVMLYTILLVVVTMLPFVTQMSGLFYLAGALFLGARFLYHAWSLLHDESGEQAMKTFGYSIVYLMALFAFLLVDHYIPLLQSLF